MTTTPLGIDFGAALGDEEISTLSDASGGAALAQAEADPRQGLAYDVPKWERYLYDRCREGKGALDQSANKVEGVVENHNAAKLAAEPAPEGATAVPDLSEREREVRELGKTAADAFASEVYSRLYGDPEKREQAHSLAPWAPVAHEILDQLPEWEQLRSSVAGDPHFSALATSDVLGPIAERLPELLKEVEKEQEESEGNGEGGEGPQGAQGQGPGGGAGAGKGKKPAGPSAKDRLRAALRAGISNSQKATGDRKETLAGLAPGLEIAPPTHEHADMARLKLVESVAKDDRLREVLRRAGRLRRIADRKRLQRRSLNAREEVVDLERGNDLARVLPSQLAGMKHSLLRKLTLLRLVEGTALQYRLEGKEPQGRGPIIVLLDRSGSMTGSPNAWASAVGVACMGIAARENRPTTVIEFNGAVVQATYVDAKGVAHNVDARRNGSLTLLPGGLASAALRVAGAGAGGGTNYDAALNVALNQLPQSLRDERADLVFVTDGEADIAPETLAILTKQKELGLRVYGLCVNGGSVSGAVQAICNQIVDIDRARGDMEVVADALPA